MNAKAQGDVLAGVPPGDVERLWLFELLGIIIELRVHRADALADLGLPGAERGHVEVLDAEQQTHGAERQLVGELADQVERAQAAPVDVVQQIVDETLDLVTQRGDVGRREGDVDEAPQPQRAPDRR